jgi:hypothetical protein
VVSSAGRTPGGGELDAAGGSRGGRASGREGRQRPKPRRSCSSCKAAGRRRRTLEEVAKLLSSAMVKGGREWRRPGLAGMSGGRER